MQIKLNLARYTSIIILLLMLCLYFPNFMAWISTAISTVIGWLLLSSKEQARTQEQAIEEHIHRAIAIHDKLASMEALMNDKIERAKLEAKAEAISKLDEDWK